ncbi:tellurite resistance TerB C-terminal domain-containing protein [Anabaena sp. CCY 9910]|uniref:tellurite resistance TerB C-terminal domain-containing protein n=1 Tax=Anabaena sp. CCY 9910 TaxID=3103870 RepID=UPI0039E14C5F
MQQVIVSNRFILGIVAFSVSFGLSLVPKWNFSQAFFTGLITVVATYAAALFVDKRRRNYELLLLSSLRKRIQETEGLKSRLAREIEQLETHRSLLYTESQQLKNQILDGRSQRDSLHRDLGVFASQRKQIESEIANLKSTICSLEENQIELNNSLSTLASEKRRLESNHHVFRTEITQLQSQISDLNQEKQELENSITLLERIKPQLEEKLYELRITIQNLESEKNKQSQILLDTTNEHERLAANIDYLQSQKTERHNELQQIQNEIFLLQQERDSLQNQVWELLQQIETFNQESISVNTSEQTGTFFPFSDVLENLDKLDAENDTTSPDLPEEWHTLLKQLPSHEIQVLKIIMEQDNPHASIKKIAEANITMPNLLIDSINERANDTIGELIIETDIDVPKIYAEHIINVRNIVALYENFIARHASSN